MPIATESGGIFSAAKAGVAYFAIMFMAGFVLGTVRVLILVPQIGAFWAVFLEMPVMLTASWVVCGWVLRRFAMPALTSYHAAMGGVAFALLMVAEAALAFAIGRDPVAYLASFATAEGALGLAGQAAFALFPLIRLRTRRA